jgi:hypothetical protein
LRAFCSENALACASPNRLDPLALLVDNSRELWPEKLVDHVHAKSSWLTLYPKNISPRAVDIERHPVGTLAPRLSWGSSCNFAETVVAPLARQQHWSA